MSYNRFYKKTCGRHPPKPNVPDAIYVENDEELPLQTQLDNLRAKMSLKVRYNQALLEEVSESDTGAHKLLADIRNDNDIYNTELQEVLKSGEASALKALRSNRPFVLAMKGNTPEKVIDWLEDQLGDKRRQLDAKVHDIFGIKKKLADALRMVDDLEKWPFPGSLPWERKAIEDFTMLGVAISNVQSKKECAAMLNSKYKELLYDLKADCGRWPWTVKKLEKTCDELSKECRTFQYMLDDAIRLKKTSRHRLVLTEKEYYENRKSRHRRLLRIKKMVEEELHIKNIISRRSYEEGRESKLPSRFIGIIQSAEMIRPISEELRWKKSQVAKFEDSARTIVEIMRVEDLRHCPNRIYTIRQIEKRLVDEGKRKLETLDNLRKEKYNLLLIKNYLMYTGAQVVEDYNNEQFEMKGDIAMMEENIEIMSKRIQKYKEIINTLRLGAIGILEKFNEGKPKKEPYAFYNNILMLGKLLRDKMMRLVQTVDELDDLFDPNEEPLRNYGQYFKWTFSTASTRVGSTSQGESDEEEDEDEQRLSVANPTGDRVLTREEIKAKSNHIYKQAALKKGLIVPGQI